MASRVYWDEESVVSSSLESLEIPHFEPDSEDDQHIQHVLREIETLDPLTEVMQSLRDPYYEYDSDDIEDIELPAPEPVDLLQSFGTVNVTAECEICLSRDSPVRNRSCCQIPVCDDCMQTYFVSQLESGIKRMQCISMCPKFAHVDEIMCRLPADLKDKYYKYLVDANNDPHVKTCPKCSFVQRISREELDAYKKKRRKKKRGILVVCQDCALEWCFICHAPWHREGVTCKEFKKGDKLVRNWAKEFHFGSKNAERCPKCKVYIQRTAGCDHMTCSHCDTHFCYKCGEKYVEVTFIGNHYERFSPFGCKYNLHPDKPVLRKMIRGSALGAKILGGIILGGLAIGGAAIFVAVSPIVVPAYFGFRIRKKRRLKRKTRKAHAFSVVYMDVNNGPPQLTFLDETGNPLPLTARPLTARPMTARPKTPPLPMADRSESSSNEEDKEEDDEELEDEEVTEIRNVEAIIHKPDDEATKSSTMVEVKEETQVCVSVRNKDTQVTSADLEMQESGLVVLHVRTTRKSLELEKQPQETEAKEFTVKENEDSISDKGCFIKILKKLPSVWEKEKDGEKNQKLESLEDTKGVKGLVTPTSDHGEGDLLTPSETGDYLKQLHDENELKDPYWGLVSTSDEITYL